jgi:hypothetical protein
MAIGSNWFITNIVRKSGKSVKSEKIKMKKSERYLAYYSQLLLSDFTDFRTAGPCIPVAEIYLSDFSDYFPISICLKNGRFVNF